MWVTISPLAIFTHISVEQKPSDYNQIFLFVRGFEPCVKERMGSIPLLRSHGQLSTVQQAACNHSASVKSGGATVTQARNAKQMALHPVLHSPSAERSIVLKLISVAWCFHSRSCRVS